MTVSVTTTSTCDWTASAGTDWININGRNSGSGNGSVEVSVDRNGGAARSGFVTVAGRRVTIDQAEAPAPPAACSYSIKPGSYNSGRGPDDVVVSVTTEGRCDWTATSRAAWLTVAEGRNGSGNGTVRVHVDANTGAPRTGTVTIAGETLTVRQEGATCSYSIAPTHYEAGRGPDNVRVNVTAENGCAWTTTNDASWISIAEGRSGSGPGVVRLVVDPNNGGARSATLTIAGQNFTLSQAGCKVDLKPTNYDAGRGPDDIEIKVMADPGCTWTTTNTASWVTVADGRSGTGNGTVRLIVEANFGAARTTTVTIGGQPFSLRQEAR